MNDISSFMPKVLTMPVGVVDLTVQELTIAKRDAALKIVLTGLDIATLIKPFWDAAKNAKGAEDIIVDLTMIAKQLKDVLIRVVGNDMTTISCLSLDTAANRKKVAVLLNDPEVEKVVNEPKLGYTYSPRMFEWLRENLTTRQEYKLIDSMVELNDFAGLVKNYITLVTRILTVAREKAAEPKASDGQPST